MISKAFVYYGLMEKDLDLDFWIKEANIRHFVRGREERLWLLYPEKQCLYGAGGILKEH